MNEEHQRIEIAKSLGWIMHSRSSWEKPDGHIHQNWGGQLSCPDYLNDLNAMQGAFMKMNGWLHIEFVINLCEITRKNQGRTRDGAAAVDILSAPASDWAEAYLKTLNLWKTDDP